MAPFILDDHLPQSHLFGIDQFIHRYIVQFGELLQLRHRWPLTPYFQFKLPPKIIRLICFIGCLLLSYLLKTEVCLIKQLK